MGEKVACTRVGEMTMMDDKSKGNGKKERQKILVLISVSWYTSHEPSWAKIPIAFGHEMYNPSLSSTPASDDAAPEQ
jgi:hypothetical protein